MTELLNYKKRIRDLDISPELGRITSINGVLVEATGCRVQLGEMVTINSSRSSDTYKAEVVGLTNNKIFLMPHEQVDGLCLESTVKPSGERFRVPVGESLLGRVVNAVCEPLDNKGPIKNVDMVLSKPVRINPLQRAPINKPLATGIKAIDTFLPLGEGQRLGIFAGSGVGKSTLLGMITKYAVADVIVIAMIGERGREVGDFIRNILGTDGLSRAIMVVATAGDPAIMRRQAAYSATSIAEWFRAQGRSVLMIMDSITRFVIAQREIAIATGEPLGTRGYPPSALASLPPLIERAGNIEGQGSISAVYTVLVEGDDFNEPVADHMRSILDGHIVLGRDIAARNHFPAIDILNSVSRLAKSILSEEKSMMISRVREVLAHYEESRELIDLGLYNRGANKKTDTALSCIDEIYAFLRQSEGECIDDSMAWSWIKKIYSKLAIV